MSSLGGYIFHSFHHITAKVTIRMMKLLYLLHFLFIFNLFAAQDEGPKIITMNFQQVQNLTQEELSNLRKSALEVVLLAKKFELSVSELNKAKLAEGKNWYEFQTKIAKNPENDFEMEYLLLEKPSNNIINRVKESKVQSSKIQYRARILSLKLLFGKYVNDVTGEVSEYKVIPLNEFQEPLEGELKTPPEAKEKLKNPDQPASVLDINELDLPEFNFPPVKKVTEVEDKKEDPKIENPKKSSEGFKSEKSFPVSISNFSSPNINLEKLPYQPDLPKPSLYKTTFSYAVGLEKEAITSNIVFGTNEAVDLEINLDRLTFKFMANHFDNGNGHYFHFGGALSTNVGENEYGVGSRFMAFGDYHLDIYEEKVFAGPLAEIERNGYANLRDRGEGIKPVSTNLVWVGIGGKFVWEMSNRVVTTTLALKKTFIANSDIGPGGDSVMVEGSKGQFGIKSTVYGNWGLELNVERMNVTSVVASKINNEHTLAAFNVVYN